MLERSRLLLSIALKHISKRKRQTAVAVAGVGVGVGFFLAVSALMIGSQNDLIETLINSAPHIIISDEIDTKRVMGASVNFTFELGSAA